MDEPHICNEKCICPKCGFDLWYSFSVKGHACRNNRCRWNESKENVKQKLFQKWEGEFVRVKQIINQAEQEKTRLLKQTKADGLNTYDIGELWGAHQATVWRWLRNDQGDRTQ